jgi:hypothetical protein
MKPFHMEVFGMSSELRSLARDDPDVKLLQTIPGIEYYIALLINA